MNPQNNQNQFGLPTPPGQPPVVPGNIPMPPANTPVQPTTFNNQPVPGMQPQRPQPIPQPVQQPQPPFIPQPTAQPLPQPGHLLTQQQIATTQTTAAPVATPAPTPAQSVNSQTADANLPKVVENPISTQSSLLISELRDGLVIMKDGSFRAVVACQSINFDLMSEQEREGVEYSYQNFLNSLNFTVQILVRSQRVDIGPYIERLSKLRRNNDNMLLGILMDDYINFIDVLSQEANIMDKSFFIVIPYYSSADAEQLVQQTKNLFKTFGKKAPEVTRINRDTYNKAVDELNNRVESVVSGLFQIGINSVRLNTRELSELYYNFNNPDTAVREPLVDFTKLATTYVRKGEKQNG